MIRLKQDNNTKERCYAGTSQCKAHWQVQDLAATIENARQSFEDGIYRIFINGDEVGDALDTPVTLRERLKVTRVNKGTRKQVTV